MVDMKAITFASINVRKIRVAELKHANPIQLIHKNNLHKSRRGAIRFFKRNIFLLSAAFFKSLILKSFFSAFQLGNFLKPAWALGFPAVKRSLSTKLSTGFVDSWKNPYKTRIYPKFSTITLSRL